MNVEERIFQIIGIIIGFCLSLAILIPITIQDMTIKNKIFALSLLYFSFVGMNIILVLIIRFLKEDSLK